MSLYLVMHLCWFQQGKPLTIRVTRRKLMELSATRSFATYHKCIRELVSFGYILYEPSYDRRTASRITFLSDGEAT